jgi:hypothetical protein
VAVFFDFVFVLTFLPGEYMDVVATLEAPVKPPMSIGAIAAPHELMAAIVTNAAIISAILYF